MCVLQCFFFVFPVLHAGKSTRNKPHNSADIKPHSPSQTSPSTGSDIDAFSKHSMTYRAALGDDFLRIFYGDSKPEPKTIRNVEVAAAANNITRLSVQVRRLDKSFSSGNLPSPQTNPNCRSRKDG